MKTVILAGGLGTRISEETANRPKPMVEVGGKPILWHLLNIYSRAGFDEFVIALGYKQEVVKEYFQAFRAHNNDLTIDLAKGTVEVVRERAAERWKVQLIDTGLNTMTGGRIKRLRDVIGDETFMCTYGDGLASIDVADVLALSSSRGPFGNVDGRAAAGAIRLARDRGHAGEDVPGKSRRPAKAGSTAASSSSNPPCSTASPATTRCSSTSRSRGSRATGSSRATCTTGSGSRWTRCATSGCSKSFGRPATRRGRTVSARRPR